MMEARAVGCQLSLKVWPVGSDEPLEPQMTVIDDSVAAGILGVTTAAIRSRLTVLDC
jgi:hypothetical protein